MTKIMNGLKRVEMLVLTLWVPDQTAPRKGLIRDYLFPFFSKLLIKNTMDLSRLLTSALDFFFV